MVLIIIIMVLIIMVLIIIIMVLIIMVILYLSSVTVRRNHDFSTEVSKVAKFSVGTME